MALPAQTQLRYWGIAAVVLSVVLWFLGDVLLPFILGGAIAYFLDPVADRLERAGLSRAMATAVITVLAALLFVVVALAVVPALVRQTIQLIETAPQLFRDLQEFLTTRFPDLITEGSPVRETLASLGETVKERGGELANTALSSAMSFINILLLFVIVPVVAVYLLLDWDNMVARVDELLPREHAPTIRALARDVDATLAGFIRGMGSVCLILGTYYAVGLWLVGLNFGLVVGVIAGLLTFIPYVGAIVGGGLAIGLALFQFWGDWIWIAAVAGIFLLGQFIEGNFLTPKLVGNSVGLHPVWLILALSVFGSLFGFVGMLVAVPVAAAIGVLTRFIVGRYKDSKLYRGLDQDQSRG
ncbi:AI-2E family transporter [Salipiger marinus]|jgi:predicted PurR-regulated permease PerM|uniref:Predicted PurR-regulated permease PerM n=1 Tax=Salipiger marinus TaxID=555512 RepID=A0A1G8RFP4_9RHOB|nr:MULTISPECIES: AI-2E family transporter [Salipiger]MCD1617682.1 AI-2E family transporter [Salipiger manganoxidans]MEB3418214.1 AI-2E family transporter [Salipiger manganoxidans]SDJ15827.1 Predicted PurR-regulated permease PerM [Salipiger marinus]HBM58871.1 AI-2E family transporter [Citreicella sp.]|tara:strand:- start:198 stop:1268 length:1071 start_codon:yes stop_codon:yes gene_type:complete